MSNRPSEQRRNLCRSSRPNDFQWVAWLLLASMASMVCAYGQQTPDTAVGDLATKFQAIDIFVDSGEQKLAAYQLAVSSDSHVIRIVGIEGGEPIAFREPPFYDPKSLQQDTTILASFSIDDQLPSGRFRLARIHVEYDVAAEADDSNEPTYLTELVVAANSDGQNIDATVSVALAQGE